MRKLYDTIRALRNWPDRGRPGSEEGTREIMFPPRRTTANPSIFPALRLTLRSRKATTKENEFVSSRSECLHHVSQQQDRDGSRSGGGLKLAGYRQYQCATSDRSMARKTYYS